MLTWGGYLIYVDGMLQKVMKVPRRTAELKYPVSWSVVTGMKYYF